MGKEGFHIVFDNLSLGDAIDQNAEFIPLLSKEDEAEMGKQHLPEELPVLPIRNTVLFPGVVIPITAGRDKSIQLLREVYEGKRLLGVFSQRDIAIENPRSADLFQIGTMARLVKLLKMPDGNTTVILQGIKKCKVVAFVRENPYFTARVTPVVENQSKESVEFTALVDSIKDMALQIIKVNPNIPSDSGFAIKNIESPTFLLNFVGSSMDLPVVEKQKLLEENDFTQKANHTLKHLTIELQKLELKNDIRSKVQSDLDKQQREYFLHQQLKTIQQELGTVSYEQELQDMRELAQKKDWPESIAARFEKELVKLQRINPQVPEHGVQRNYLEFMLDLPWGKCTEDKICLARAESILDRDHYGLEDVKERILEYLAVLKIKDDLKSPILCLYGPPGVGKTSLGKSIAEALGRKYVRMSLGGLHDESEIRGHRKTYIGAMSGRLLQSIRKAGTSNPVFVLDEIDKMGQRGHGDPSSAMLEVLDPEQNTEFYDNFLEEPYDLSRILFVATANNVAGIQPALRDRMEIIEVSGYTLAEKVEIAKRHLLPKQLKAHGLTSKDLKLGKCQIEKIIEGYTRESGVRTLEKRISKLLRHAAKSIAKSQAYTVKMMDRDIEGVLGTPEYTPKYEHNRTPGVVTGLAWTSVGGDILFIESILSKGSGKLSLTGNLGKVMKESATIALEYIKAHAADLGIDRDSLEKCNIHIHVPEGATPKDGPSAGIAMLTSMTSSFTRRRVKSHLAMTGEITLRGRVLPVGGIKEKILAAKRADIRDIILSAENRKDVAEIKPSYVKGLRFHYVDEMQQALDIALLKQRLRQDRKRW
ncbi:MAG: endopeptidase La [Flavobacteriales bacterium]